jgi:hypothetical protein
MHEGEVETFSEGLRRGSTFTLHTAVSPSTNQGTIRSKSFREKEHRPCREFGPFVVTWSNPHGGQNNRRGGSTARIIGRFGDAPEVLAGQSSAGFDKLTASEDEIKGSPATPGRSL